MVNQFSMMLLHGKQPSTWGRIIGHGIQPVSHGKMRFPMEKASRNPLWCMGFLDVATSYLYGNCCTDTSLLLEVVGVLLALPRLVPQVRALHNDGVTWRGGRRGAVRGGPRFEPAGKYETRGFPGGTRAAQWARRPPSLAKTLGMLRSPESLNSARIERGPIDGVLVRRAGHRRDPSLIRTLLSDSQRTRSFGRRRTRSLVRSHQLIPTVARAPY